MPAEAPPAPVHPPAPWRPPRGRLPLVRGLLLARGDRLGFLEWAAARGDVARLRMGRRLLFLVSHPAPAERVLRENAANYTKGMGMVEARAFLGDGLLTAEGESWARQRRGVRPAFRPEVLEGCIPAVEAAAGRLAARWSAAAAEGRGVDGMAEAGRATLEVLLGALFRAPLTGGEEALVEDFAVASEYAVGRITALPFTDRLPTPGNLRYRRALASLHAYAAALARESAGSDAPLAELASRSEAGAVITLLLAGHETTAAAVAWTWHLLSLHPAEQARVREEARAAGGSAAAAALPRTTMAVREAMRLFPPVWLLPRISRGGDEVGGVEVPPGSHVIVSPYTIHRHPGLWPRPTEFDPGRFDGARELPPHGYLPFGVGERACPGARLAMLEAPAIVAAAVRRFHLSPAPGVQVRPAALLTLRPLGGLPLRLRPVER